MSPLGNFHVNCGVTQPAGDLTSSQPEIFILQVRGQIWPAVSPTVWLSDRWDSANSVAVYITLLYNTLHYITLLYITLHYITLHYITLQYITLHLCPASLGTYLDLALASVALQSCSCLCLFSTAASVVFLVLCWRSPNVCNTMIMRNNFLGN